MRRQMHAFAFRTTLLAAACALVACRAGVAPGEREKTTLNAAIADVEAGRTTTPLVGRPDASGDVTVTFLVKDGSGRVPRIVSDVTGWGEQADGGFSFDTGRMRRIGGTAWYSLDVKIAPGSRVEYLVAHGQMDYQPDPLNPRRAPMHPDNPVSELVTPGYRPPQAFVDPPATPAGTVRDVAVESRALGGPRHVRVYTPPGHRRDGDYPLAVFYYGTNMVQRGEVPRVIDYLVARRTIEPILAVFADPDAPGDSTRERAMRTFFTGELPMWMASRFGATRDPVRRAIVGMSFGAKGALDAALGPPGPFGLVGLLIPGRAADVEAIRTGHRRQLRVAVVAGRYDGPNLSTARRIRQALLDAGDNVDYIEASEGHNPATWRNHMSEMLVSLFGPGRRGSPPPR
jgi:enterochelin esterase-like enzyme